jgi:hypothetical protein
MKIQILRDDGKVEREIETQNSFMILYSDLDGPCYDVQNLHHMRFSDKHVLKNSYIDTVGELKEKYSTYLYSVLPDKIAFMVDEQWEQREKSNKNSRWKIDIKRASFDFSMLTGYEYIIKARQYWIDRWSEAQLHAAIFGQLMRINPEDGSILKYSEDFHSKMISTFGAGYLEPQTVIPDLLKERVRIRGFKQANGQICMDEMQDDKEGEDDAA